MKKLLTFLLVLFLGFSLVSCGDSGNDVPSNPTNQQEQNQNENNDNQGTHVDSNGNIIFAENETNIENLKTSIRNLILEKYNIEKQSMTEDNKVTLDIVYKSLDRIIQNVTGSVDEVKTKLTEHYNTFKTAVENIKKVYSSFADKKQNALSIAELVYNSLTIVVNKENLDYVTNLYNLVKTQINDLQNTAEFDNELKEIFDNYKGIAIQYAETIISAELENLIKQAKAQLDTLYNELLQKVSDEEIKNSIDEVYSEAKILLSGIIDKAKYQEKVDEIFESFKTKIYEISSDLIELKVEELKALAREKLDEVINPLIAKIEDETLQNSIQTFYNIELDKIETITDKETASAVTNEVVADTTEFAKEILAQALQALKTKAIEELDAIVNPALEKLKTEELKTELTNFYNTEVQKINDINDLETAKTTMEEIVSDTRDFALELVASQIAELKALVKGYVTTLSNTISESPYSYIPAAMKPGYENNLVDAEDVTYDFSTFVDVDDIVYGGFGKQWNMVIDNITQSENFYKYLNKGDSVITSALLTVTEYLDSKYSDTINKIFETEKFKAEIAFENNILTYSVEFKVSMNVSLLGEIKPLVEMTYDVESGNKVVLITISETNKVKYEVSVNSYILAMEYGITAGSRTTYLSLDRDGSNVEGHIYEYNTVKGKDLTKSCADFYITNEYVTVVGNKADAMMGSKGYICEVYKSNEGKLLGYEVRETISSVSYNTLWFNLCDISGIESIKIGEKTDANTSGKSENDVYLNGSETLFIPEYNTKILVGKTSRKFDIEFRTQYFYSKDGEGNIVEHEVLVPMMFIQEDNDKDTNFTDYPADMLKNNGITSSVTLSSTYLNKIKDDYDTYVDAFIENKTMMSSENIKTYIEE